MASNQLQQTVDAYDALKKSDIAIREDDVAALKAMPTDDLVHLAWQALRTCKDLEPYGFGIGCLEDVCEGPGDSYVCWVIAQADGGNNRGGFNKWSKALGGTPPGTSGIHGGFLIFETWKEARAALDGMRTDDYDPDLYLKIYPVVLFAGNEPRITCPPSEKS